MCQSGETWQSVDSLSEWRDMAICGLFVRVERHGNLWTLVRVERHGNLWTLVRVERHGNLWTLVSWH
jgi:hypothetical protein